MIKKLTASDSKIIYMEATKDDPKQRKPVRDISLLTDEYHIAAI